MYEYVANITQSIAAIPLLGFFRRDVLLCYRCDDYLKLHRGQTRARARQKLRDFSTKTPLVLTDVTDVETNVVLDASLKDAQPIRSSCSYSP